MSVEESEAMMATAATTATTATLAPATTLVGGGPAAEERLLFWLDAEPYLVRLVDLKVVLSQLPQVAQLPHSPPWLWGIFPLETALAALVDLRAMLREGPGAVGETKAAAISGATAPSSLLKDDRMALVTGDDELTLALIVDRLGDVYPDDAITPLPEEFGGVPGDAPTRHYSGTRFAVGGVSAPVPELRLGALLTDVLSAIEERDPYG